MYCHFERMPWFVISISHRAQKGGETRDTTNGSLGKLHFLKGRSFSDGVEDQRVPVEQPDFGRKAAAFSAGAFLLSPLTFPGMGPGVFQYLLDDARPLNSSLPVHDDVDHVDPAGHVSRQVEEGGEKWERTHADQSVVKYLLRARRRNKAMMPATRTMTGDANKKVQYNGFAM